MQSLVSSPVFDLIGMVEQSGWWVVLDWGCSWPHELVLGEKHLLHIHTVEGLNFCIAPPSPADVLLLLFVLGSQGGGPRFARKSAQTEET